LIRRLGLLLLAALTIVLSSAGYAIGAFVGLIIAGVVAGYTWGWSVVMDEGKRAAVVVDEDDD
jgi:Kef-type K+ transport system membrane component KefB